MISLPSLATSRPTECAAAPGTATEQDILDADDHEDRLFELVDGVMVEKPIGIKESILASAVQRGAIPFCYT